MVRGTAPPFVEADPGDALPPQPAASSAVLTIAKMSGIRSWVSRHMKSSSGAVIEAGCK
jgi:hypothetical protein